MVVQAQVQAPARVVDWQVNLVEGEAPRLEFSPELGIEPPMSAASGSRTWRRGATAVVVSQTAIAFEAEQLLRIVDGRVDGDMEGHTILPLFAALRPALATEPKILLLADRRLRFDRLLEVLHTASHAGATDWYVVMRGPEDAQGVATRAIEIEPPERSQGLAPLDVLPQQYSLTQSNREFVLLLRITTETLEVAELWHTGELRRIARVRREEGWGPVLELARAADERLSATAFGLVVVTAAPDVPLERLVGALTAVEGVGCSMDGEQRGNCWFPYHMVIGGDMTLEELVASRGGVVVEVVGERTFHAESRCYPGSPDRAELRVVPSGLVDLDIDVTIGGREPPRMRVNLPGRGGFTLTEGAGCSQFVVRIDRQPSIHAEVLREGEVVLECETADVMVRGRLRFWGCR